MSTPKLRILVVAAAFVVLAAAARRAEALGTCGKGGATGTRKQVTFDGKPLYTFVEDTSPDTVTGNGVSDSFDGTSFTWHVASIGTTQSGSTSTQGGYGY